MQDKPSSPEVPLEKLRWRCVPESFPFDTTADLPPLEGIIGQERAKGAGTGRGNRQAGRREMRDARPGGRRFGAAGGVPGACHTTAGSATFLPSNILSARACSPYRLARGRS